MDRGIERVEKWFLDILVADWDNIPTIFDTNSLPNQPVSQLLEQTKRKKGIPNTVMTTSKQENKSFQNTLTKGNTRLGKYSKSSKIGDQKARQDRIRSMDFAALSDFNGYFLRKSLKEACVPWERRDSYPDLFSGSFSKYLQIRGLKKVGFG